MGYRIRGLDRSDFEHLFGLDDAALARHGACRVVADAKPGFPERIGLRDAEPGEVLLLANYVHQPADTPYRASHAVYVALAAGQTHEGVDALPDALVNRLLSLRAFDAHHMMIAADVADGHQAEPLIHRLLAVPEVAYIHVHFARQGCYAARIDRA